MPIDIPATIASINGGISLAKSLATASTEMDKAELKLKIVDLVDQLIAAKDALVDARVELEEMERALQERGKFTDELETLVEWQGFKYKCNEQGERLGQPYCPRCMEVDRRLVTLHQGPNQSDWDRSCPQCKNDYLVDKLALEQFDAETRAAAAAYNSNLPDY